jgi:hypothetical protein
MFKRICLFLLAALMLFSVQKNVLAREVSTDIESRDVLFMYDDELSEQAHENVAAIADILTYMGYSTYYCTVSESKGILDSFTHIIFYHEGNSIEQSFLDELGKLNNKIMVVGGGDIAGLLEALKLPLTYDKKENAISQITYSFNEEKQISMFIKTQNSIMLKGNFSYSRGTVTTEGQSASLCIRKGRLSNIAVFDSSNDMLKSILIEQISLWKWPYDNEPNTYPQYVIFDEVYPFSDTGKMMKVIDTMKKSGIPFVITVMPVYQNGEYPAMKHFCEVLSYAQANGAAIILKAPIINTDKPSLEDINKKISIAFSAYCSYGVYPIGIEAPNNWIHKKMGQDILRNFSTVVLTPDKNDNSWSDKDRYNSIYSDGHQIIAPAFGDIGDNVITAYPTALFLSMDTDINDLQVQIEKLLNSAVPLKSLWLSPHSVYTSGNKYLSYNDNILTVNGKVQSLEFVPFKYDADFQYNRGIIGRMSDSIERENKKLLLLVIAISLLFIIFIVIARNQNRKRFLYKSEEQ